MGEPTAHPFTPRLHAKLNAIGLNGSRALSIEAPFFLNCKEQQGFDKLSPNDSPMSAHRPKAAYR